MNFCGEIRYVINAINKKDIMGLKCRNIYVSIKSFTGKKHILYVHGYNGDPYGSSFQSLKEAIGEEFELFSVDYDANDPVGAVECIKSTIEKYEIDLVIGASLGGFLTMQLAGVSRIVVNPCWNPVVELPKIGYEGPLDGYERLLNELNEHKSAYEKTLCSGCFAAGDELLGTRYMAEFGEHFDGVYSISGGHKIVAESAREIIHNILPKHVERVKGMLADLRANYEDVVPYEYEAASCFESSGLATVMQNGKWGCINKKGEVVVPFEYDEEVWFDEDETLAIVVKDGKYGVIDEHGGLVVPLKYDSICYFNEGLAKVKLNKKLGVINDKGEEVLACEYDSIADWKQGEFFSVEVNGKGGGYADRTGNVVVPCEYDDVNRCANCGVFAVKLRNGKWGFVNHRNECIVPFQYDYACSFDSEGLATVKCGGKWGCIDTKGEMVIPFEYDSSIDFESNGLADVRLGDKRGFINRKGEIVIPCQYDYVGKFDANGLCSVRLGDKWGCINTQNEFVIPCEFDCVGNLNYASFREVSLGGKCGCYNAKIEQILPCEYDSIDFHYDDKGEVILVKKDDEWSFYSVRNSVFYPCPYKLFTTFENDMLMVWRDGKNGYINRQCSLVIPCQYETAKDFGDNGLASVKLNGKWGCIDKQGEVVVPFDFDEIGYMEEDNWIVVKKSGRWGYIKLVNK